MNHKVIMGVGTWKFPDVTLTTRGVAFSLSEEGIPSVTPEDRMVISSVLKDAREQGKRVVDYVFEGRTLPTKPVSFTVRFDVELGSCYDVYQDGKEPRIGLQESRYRAYQEVERAIEDYLSSTPPEGRHSTVVDPPSDGDVVTVQSPKGWRFEVIGNEILMVRKRRGTKPKKPTHKVRSS